MKESVNRLLIEAEDFFAKLMEKAKVLDAFFTSRLIIRSPRPLYILIHKLIKHRLNKWEVR